MKDKINAYFISKRANDWAIFFAIILLIVFFALRYWESSLDAEYTKSIIESVLSEESLPLSSPPKVLSAVEDIIVILITLIVSSLISSLLIEKNQQNKIYSEALSDFCNDSNIHIRFDDVGTLSGSVEKDLAKKSVPKDMLGLALKKILDPEKAFYYDSCEIEIICSIENGMLKKTISKKIELRSYDETYTFSPQNRSEYVLARYCGPKTKKTPISIDAVRINGKDEKGFHILKSSISAPLTNKQGYTKQYVAYYDRDLTIFRKNSTKMIVDYTTFAPLNDLTYVFRIPCACKKLHFRYQLKDMKGYSLAGHAFGFFDDATSSHNTKEENQLEFFFEDWIFQRDGICICMNNSSK